LHHLLLLGLIWDKVKRYYGESLIELIGMRNNHSH